MYYFGDLDVGMARQCGQISVSEEEIIEFATKWDPQPFHVDREAAAETIFEGVIASGLHTLCFCNRLTYDGLLGNVAIVAGKGLEDLRFPHPVYPDDTISVQIEVVEKKPTDEWADRGIVHFHVEGINQWDKTVISFVSLPLVKR